MKPEERLIYALVFMVVAGVLLYVTFGTDLLDRNTGDAEEEDPLLESIPGAQAEGEEIPEPLFPEAEFSLLTTLTLTDNAGGDVVAIRQAEDEPVWEVVEVPVGTDEGLGLDQERIESAVVSLPRLTPSQVFEDVEAAELGAFGLEEPAYTVAFTTTDGEEYAFLVGSMNPSGASYYISLPGEEDTVYLVAAFEIDSIINFLSLPPFIIPTEEAIPTAEG